MSEAVAVQVNNLEKSFGDLKVVHDVSLSVRESGVLSIIGASGSGKSTLLRCLNLLEMPDRGDLMIAGEQVHFERDRHGRRRVSTTDRFSVCARVWQWCSSSSTCGRT